MLSLCNFRNFRQPDSWKLLLLVFIDLSLGLGVEYYSHASIPIPIATPSEANPTCAFST
jgi:hypothetical protein